MGISGLLQKLASITTSITLEDLANLTVGVDAYVWLHKASYSCASELVQNVPTDKYIHYCMNLVRMLQHFGIRPVLVFDGAPLPTKGGKEDERRAKREENKKQALEHLLNGNKSAAEEAFQRAVNVTPFMAFNLIQVLKEANVDYVVAPYEADAQLAYLALNGHVDAVITEDSDLVAYGAPRVVVKMDKFGGGKEIKLTRMAQATEFDFSTFTHTNFRHMCILAGCDYVSNVAGIGMVKAYKLVHKHRDPAKIFKALQLDSSIDFPPNYPEYFRRADLTFQHQRVYDPVAKKVVPLTPLPPQADATALDFIGPPIDDETAVQICTGIIDPFTREPFELKQSLSSSSKLARSFSRSSSRSNLSNLPETPQQKNDLSKYLSKSAASTPGSASMSRKRSNELIAPDTPPEERESTAKKVVVKSRFFAAKDENANVNGGASAFKIQTKRSQKSTLFEEALYTDLDAEGPVDSPHVKTKMEEERKKASDEMSALLEEIKSEVSVAEAPQSPFKGPPKKKPRTLDSFYHTSSSTPTLTFRSPFVKTERLTLPPARPADPIDLTDDLNEGFLESKFRSTKSTSLSLEESVSIERIDSQEYKRFKVRSRSTELFEAIELGQETVVKDSLEPDNMEVDVEDEVQRRLSNSLYQDGKECKLNIEETSPHAHELLLPRAASMASKSSPLDLGPPIEIAEEEEDEVVPKHFDLSRFAFKRSKSLFS